MPDLVFFSLLVSISTATLYFFRFIGVPENRKSAAGKLIDRVPGTVLVVFVFLSGSIGTVWLVQTLGLNSSSLADKSLRIFALIFDICGIDGVVLALWYLKTIKPFIEKWKVSGRQ